MKTNHSIEKPIKVCVADILKFKGKSSPASMANWSVQSYGTDREKPGKGRQIEWIRNMQENGSGNNINRLLDVEMNVVVRFGNILSNT